MGKNERGVEMTKEAKIKKEIKRYSQLFAGMDESKKQVASALIEKAAFMGVSLDELQEIIDGKGYVETYQNGANQSGYKKCSEVEIYNTMIKNYGTIIKQLNDMLPDSKVAETKRAGEELAKFLARGKK